MSTNFTVTRICLFCGKEFQAKTTVTKYCSKPCSRRDYKKRIREKKIKKSNQQVKEIIDRPINAIKEKEILSIKDVCTLTGVSRTTLWRMEKSGLLKPGLFNGRKLYKRADIDKLFSTSDQHPKSEKLPESLPAKRHIDTYSIDELYSLATIYEKYSITPDGLYRILKRNEVQKKRIGKEVYVPIEEIKEILG